MSLRSMTWALERAPVTDPTQVVLLIALGDRANEGGTGAWPSVRWLAERARCSPRTVHRHLAEMELAGVIRRGDQRSVQHLRGDRRPVVWDLAVEMSFTEQPVNLSPRHLTTGQLVTPLRQDNLSPRETPRGDTAGIHGVTPVADKPSLEPSLVLIPASEPTKVTARHFEEWWITYPRKAGKGAARKAYDKASRLVGRQVLLDAALRFRADPNRSDQYTPHPATWLNGERWDDDQIPSESVKPLGASPSTSPDAVTAFLRQMWQEGRAKAVADRSGLRYPQPDVPEEITTGAGAWVKQQARDWIAAHHDEALAAIIGRDAA